MVVISNTTPLNYLILIGLVDVLPVLYVEISIPEAVFAELQRDKTPQPVREWIVNRPEWLFVKQVQTEDLSLERLHAGEREAILLAKQIKADALIIDERDGRRAAQRLGIRVIGTMRVLADAAEAGLCNLEDALDRLQQTSFRLSSRLKKAILDAHIWDKEQSDRQ